MRVDSARSSLPLDQATAPEEEITVIPPSMIQKVNVANSRSGIDS